MKESDIERAITDFLNVALPADAVHFHIPNGGKRGWKAQREMKAAGLLAGMPDRCVIWKGLAIFFECKSPRGRLRPEQAIMMERLGRAGAATYIVRSVEDVEETLIAMGIPLRAGLPR